MVETHEAETIDGGLTRTDADTGIARRHVMLLGFRVDGRSRLAVGKRAAMARKRRA